MRGFTETNGTEHRETCGEIGVAIASLGGIGIGVHCGAEVSCRAKSWNTLSWSGSEDFGRSCARQKLAKTTEPGMIASHIRMPAVYPFKIETARSGCISQGRPRGAVFQPARGFQSRLTSAEEPRRKEAAEVLERPCPHGQGCP